MSWLLVVASIPAGLVLGSLIWAGTGWLYTHQPHWLARYMKWLNHKAGLDIDGTSDDG